MSDAATRLELQRVATHVLARRRHEVSGRFGLRASPGGIATPAFGDAPEVLRTSGTALVHEVGGDATSTEIDGSTLRRLCEVVGADPEAHFEAGSDTPPVGDLDGALALDPAAVAVMAEWWSLGWEVLDSVVAGLGPTASPSTLQLWPEHFDAGTTVALPSTKVNLGFSPGDAWCDEPYAYVGPWGGDRPGAPELWDAPFGAALRRSDAGADPRSAVTSWIGARLSALGG